MFNLGMGEITIVLMLALIFLGPKKLPELASGLGKLIREIRKTTSDVKNEIQLDDSIRKPFEELREAVTLHPDELKRRDRIKRELEDLKRQAEAVVAEAEAAADAVDHAGESAQSESAQDGSQSDPASSEATLADGTAHIAGAAHDEIGSGPPSAPSISGPGASTAQVAAAPGESVTPPLVLAPPAVPGAAPTGTVARAPSGPHAAPPAPPLAAVLAKGTGAAAPASVSSERRAAQPPSGSEFVRALRAVPESKRPLPRRTTAAATPTGPSPDSAADRANTTQALTEADLAAITVRPPPPPAPPGSSPVRATPPPPPPARLPGSTPPKSNPDK